MLEKQKPLWPTPTKNRSYTGFSKIPYPKETNGRLEFVFDVLYKSVQVFFACEKTLALFQTEVVKLVA